MFSDKITWQCMAFNDLNLTDWHHALLLRQTVFIVEQNCPYQDADTLDLISLHVSGFAYNGDLIAYARITPPNTRFTEPSIGRVVVPASHRKQGIGRELMKRAIYLCQQAYPNQRIRISAQTYLQDFYSSLNFNAIGKPYDEDGIPHISMLLPTKT